MIGKKLDEIYTKLRSLEVAGGCERHGHLYVPQNGTTGYTCVYCGKAMPKEKDPTPEEKT